MPCDLVAPTVAFRAVRFVARARSSTSTTAAVPACVPAVRVRTPVAERAAHKPVRAAPAMRARVLTA